MREEPDRNDKQIKVKIKSGIPLVPFEKGDEKQNQSQSQNPWSSTMIGAGDSPVVEGLVSRNLRINQQSNPEQDLYYFFSEKK